MPGPGIRSSRSSSFGEGPCAGHGINARWPGQGATVHPRGRPLPSPVRPSLIRWGMAGQGSSRFGAAALGYPSGGHPLLDARRQGGATSTLDADGERGSDGCRHRLRPCGSRLRPAPRRPGRVRPGRAPARPASGRRQPGRAVVAAGDARSGLGARPRRRLRRHARALRLRPPDARRPASADRRVEGVPKTVGAHRSRPAKPPPWRAGAARRPARGPGLGRRRRHHPHSRRRCRDPAAMGTQGPRAAPPPRRRRADPVPTADRSATAWSSACT